MTAPEREALVKALLDEAADLRNAPAGGAKDEQHNYNWADKPHRCLYDACALVERAVAALSSPAVTVTEEARDIINSNIVDAFVKAIEDYGDNKTSRRQDFRHALTAVAPLIIARALKSTTPQTGSQE